MGKECNSEEQKQQICRQSQQTWEMANLKRTIFSRCFSGEKNQNVYQWKRFQRLFTFALSAGFVKCLNIVPHRFKLIINFLHQNVLDSIQVCKRLVVSGEAFKNLNPHCNPCGLNCKQQLPSSSLREILLANLCGSKWSVYVSRILYYMF